MLKRASSTGEPDDWMVYGKRFGMTMYLCKDCHESNKDAEVKELDEDEYEISTRFCHNCMVGNKSIQKTYYRFFGKYADQYKK